MVKHEPRVHEVAPRQIERLYPVDRVFLNGYTLEHSSDDEDCMRCELDAIGVW